MLYLALHSNLPDAGQRKAKRIASGSCSHSPAEPTHFCRRNHIISRKRRVISESGVYFTEWGIWGQYEVSLEASVMNWRHAPSLTNQNHLMKCQALCFWSQKNPLHTQPPQTHAWSPQTGKATWPKQSPQSINHIHFPDTVFPIKQNRVVVKAPSK